MHFFSPPRSLLLLVMLCAAVAIRPAHAQMEMPPHTIGAVMEAAEADGTPILLEIYAPWCPYCQRMQQTVYADSTVQAYLDRHFTYARLNRDTTAGAHRYADQVFSSDELARALGARGVPTTIFLQADGTPIARQPGYIRRASFLRMLRYVGSGAYRNQSFEAFRTQQSK